MNRERLTSVAQRGLLALLIVVVAALLAPTDLIALRGKALHGIVGAYDYCDGHLPTYSPGPGISASLLAPGAGTTVLPGQKITISVNASDVDHLYVCDYVQEVAGSASITDISGGGAFGAGSNGDGSWTAPATPGVYTLTITVDDGGGAVDPPAIGSTDDPPVTLTAQITVGPSPSGVNWDQDTPISGGINSPSAGASLMIGEELPCSASASDNDTRTDADGTTNVADILTYSWTATGGHFKDELTSGPDVTWVPDAPGEFTISVVIDDMNDANKPQGEGGSRNDPRLPLDVETSQQCTPSTCDIVVNVLIPTPNVEIQGLTEATEEDPGAFIPLNNDDDNGNNTEDSLDVGEVPHEGELLKVKLSVLTDAGTAVKIGTAELGIGANLEVYADAQRKAKLTARSWDLAVDTLPAEIYVEAFAPTEGVIPITLTYTVGGKTKVDKVNLTVVDFELVNPVKPTMIAGVPHIQTPADAAGYGNEFTYDIAVPGVLRIPVVVSTDPNTPAVQSALTDHVTVNAPTITGSMLSQDPNTGKAAYSDGKWQLTLNYTGLPQANTQFGRKTLAVQVALPQITFKISRNVEVFFARDAMNNPTLDRENWYYYWWQTSAKWIPAPSTVAGTGFVFFWAPGEGASNTEWSDIRGDYICIIRRTGRFVNGDPGFWQGAQGIDFFANVLRHEDTHRRQRIYLHGHNKPTGVDTDGDGLPDFAEGPGANKAVGIGGLRYDPTNPYTNPNTFNYPNPPGGTAVLNGFLRDNEHWCCSHQPPWNKGSASKEDWASPGMQHGPGDGTGKDDDPND